MKAVNVSKVTQKPSARWRVRVFSSVGAAAAILVALWAADVRFGYVDPGQWVESVRDWWRKDWFPETNPQYAIPPKLPTSPVTNSDEKKPAPAVLPGTDSSISETTLQLVLVSTERGRNAREGTARLGTHAENPQTYMAGAILANGSRLLEIYDDRVVLQRDGKQATLFLASSGKKSTSDLFLVGGSTRQAEKQFVPTQREVLTDYIRPSPVYDGQTLRGYEVYAGTRSGVFGQLGLQNGDVVLSINEQPLVDPKSAMDAFHQLTSGMPVSATVDRKGKIERLSLDGAVILADQEQMKNSSQLVQMPPGV